MHNSMGKCFGLWARFLVRHSKRVGWFFVLIYLLLSLNLGFFKEVEAEEIAWAPFVSNYSDDIIMTTCQGNLSLQNRDRGEALFSNNNENNGRILANIDDEEIEPADIVIIMEGKSISSDSAQNLLTIDRFREMIEF